MPFYGDWQSPSDSLLWSADFQTDADLSKIEGASAAGYSPSPTGIASLGVSASQGASNTPESFPNCVVYSGHSETSGNFGGQHPQMIMRAANFPFAGTLLSGVKFWLARGGDRTSGQCTVNGSPVPPSWTGDVGLSKVWQEFTIPLSSINPDIRIHVMKNSGLTAEARSISMTGLRFYGVTGTYSINDVVVHAGSYFRSLYDSNAEEPGTGSKWVSFSIPV